MTHRYQIAIAGSTSHTLQCARSLANDPRFEVSLIVTPEPKPVGRKQIVTPNPLHKWAKSKQIPIIAVDKKIDKSNKKNIIEANELLKNKGASGIDFLLVVDFGYLIPNWLLALPTYASLNIHPSLLPKWRGSSPGQFVLLSGETDSAVTLMKMDSGLDTGPILAQIPFSIEKNWTQQEYYTRSFELITAYLPGLIADFGAGQLKAQQQPSTSPTQIARRLSKEDSFVPWEVIQDAMSATPTPSVTVVESLPTLLQSFYKPEEGLAPLLERATRAFDPWPQLWTKISTSNGEKRMKILSATNQHQHLLVKTVQIEGQTPKPWNQVKNGVR